MRPHPSALHIFQCNCFQAKTAAKLLILFKKGGEKIQKSKIFNYFLPKMKRIW